MTEETLVTISTVEEARQLIAYLEDKEYVAYDTETTGLSRESEIIGFSVCADVDCAYYVILAEWNVVTQQLDYLETQDVIFDFLRLIRKKSAIMHNAVFDCMITNAQYAFDLMPAVHTDTMILAHLLDENRHCGLKELGVSIFGEDAAKEQAEMKASIVANGGQCTKTNFELYKADSNVIAKYGAKDALLTLKLFYHLVPILIEQGLYDFFYEDESMPLLRSATYDLNTTGLRIDPVKLLELEKSLEADCLSKLAFINNEIKAHVQDKYPGTNKKNHFNIGSGQQLAWLLFDQLGCEFDRLTDGGKAVSQYLINRLPYTKSTKNDFIAACKANIGQEYDPGGINTKTGKIIRPKCVAEPWKYMKTDKETLQKFVKRFKWVQQYLEYAKDKKLLSTYVEGIKDQMKYNIIRPGFKQHGTTSGRYSSQRPNFQNLPREDKRVKACIVPRQGMVFVAADQSQLEPRCFASASGDPTLQACFASGEDFYSVIGAPTFGITGVSMIKDDPNSFAKKYPKLRDNSKVFGLATPYGRTAREMARKMGVRDDETQEMIDNYFERYPKVKQMMLDAHEEAKTTGVVYNLYGRPRRIPAAMEIPQTYGKNTTHADLPYQARTLLNLAMNHKVQSTAASVMNRAAIAVCKELYKQGVEARIVLQVHDELVLECPEANGPAVAAILQQCMENAVILPGVKLEAKPVIGRSLAELK